TTSESGVSDLDTTMTDFRCNCCPYGYHLDTDFMKFLDDMYGPDVLRTLKKIERKRHDVRRRLINGQQPIQNLHTRPPIPPNHYQQQHRSTSYERVFDQELLRETLLELDRIVEKDIKELEAQCRHKQHSSGRCTPNSLYGTEGRQQQSSSSHNRSRSVDSRYPRRQHVTRLTNPPQHTLSTHNVYDRARTEEEHRLYEHRMQMEKTITTRTLSTPGLSTYHDDHIKKFDVINTSAGPITMLYKIPPPPFSRSSSSSSLSTETTLRVSSPEPEEHREPLKPLYITEVIVPPKPIRLEPVQQTTIITIPDKSEIERRNREIDRLEHERYTLLKEKNLLLKEIERYKYKPPAKTVSTTSYDNKKYTLSIDVKSPDMMSTRDASINVEGGDLSESEEHLHRVETRLEEIIQQQKLHQKPATREVAMMHVVEEPKEVYLIDHPPPLPPKQYQQQRDVAISHITEEYDFGDDNEDEQTDIIKRKLEDIKNYYTERIHILEDKIYEQEQEIEHLTEPKSQRHVSMQCQPLMTDRALVTDTFRSVRDVALTCHLLDDVKDEIVHKRDVNLQCNLNDFIHQRDVWIEVKEQEEKKPTVRDVSIGVQLNLQPDIHYRDVATHVNFDYKPEIIQRDVAVMIQPEKKLMNDKSSNTQQIQTKEFGSFANTIEPPKPPPKPSMRPAATDTRTLISYKDIATGPSDTKRWYDRSTDTLTLLQQREQATGNDIPAVLLNRTVATDTRTLVSTRDNFSTTTLSKDIFKDIGCDTKSLTQYHDTSVNTNRLEQQNASVQCIPDVYPVKQAQTNTELDIFYQLGHYRHALSNTDLKRSTDRSTLTDLRPSRDLGINTEPKIMYSKDVGDFDVRVKENEQESRYTEEITWNKLVGAEPLQRSLHDLSSRTFGTQSDTQRTSDRSLMTDLYDTKRDVGYTEYVRRTSPASSEDTVQEQRQEIITFRIPGKDHLYFVEEPPVPREDLTEETYEQISTTTTETRRRQIEEMMTKQKQLQRQDEETRRLKTQTQGDTRKYEPGMTIVSSEYSEWSRPFGISTTSTTTSSSKQQQTSERRSNSPEDLVEESYEVVQTITKPPTDFKTTSAFSPFGIQSGSHYTTVDTDTVNRSRTVNSALIKTRGQDIKPASSEDDSSFYEEWTVTEAKRKQDGQTVKTIIDRGGHHRYTVDAEEQSQQGILRASSSSDEKSRKRLGESSVTFIETGDEQYTGESSSHRGGFQVKGQVEESQTSPTMTYTVKDYESRKTFGGGSSTLTSSNTSGFRTLDASASTTPYSPEKEDEIEEKYEVIISSYDESGIKEISPKREDYGTPEEDDDNHQSSNREHEQQHQRQQSTIMSSSGGTEQMISSSSASSRTEAANVQMESEGHEEFELDEEMYIACVIVNESLYDKNADKKKVQNCLKLIQQDWFRVSSQKQANVQLVENYLNSFKKHFSNFLLERIVNMQDANGNTALHYCVTNGNWAVVNLLLDTKVCDVCLQNNAGYTAVMMAAVIRIDSEDQRNTVRRLFKESGNVNVKTTSSNQTALMLAVKHDKPDVVELLLENSAAVNLQDSDGSTALMCAVEHELFEIVKLLLTRPECDVNIADNDGATAISIATSKNRKDILVALYAQIKEQKGHHSALGKSRTMRFEPHDN
ncbi:unnamed protein product, partial [Didymodactylos carnosus]